MTKDELRVLDGKVHEALYPGVTLAVRGGGDIPTHWLDVGRMVEIPYYTTDIMAWKPVYALKPGWRWFQQEEPDATRVVVHTCGEWEFFGVWVEPFEAAGLAAYALGRARCVIEWAGRGEG